LGTYTVKRRLRIRADCLNCGQTDHDNQGQHYCVLDCGRAVFGNKEAFDTGSELDHGAISLAWGTGWKWTVDAKNDIRGFGPDVIAWRFTIAIREKHRRSSFMVKQFAGAHALILYRAGKSTV
jgi:hypothetical protein